MHRIPFLVAVALGTSLVAAGASAHSPAPRPTAAAGASPAGVAGTRAQLVQHVFTSGAISAESSDTARITFVNGLDVDLTVDIYILDGDGEVLAESKSTAVPTGTTGSLDVVLNKAVDVHGKVILTGSPKIRCDGLPSVLEIETASGTKLIDNWGHVHLKTK